MTVHEWRSISDERIERELVIDFAQLNRTADEGKRLRDKIQSMQIELASRKTWSPEFAMPACHYWGCHKRDDSLHNPLCDGIQYMFNLPRGTIHKDVEQILWLKVFSDDWAEMLVRYKNGEERIAWVTFARPLAGGWQDFTLHKPDSKTIGKLREKKQRAFEIPNVREISIPEELHWLPEHILNPPAPGNG